MEVGFIGAGAITEAVVTGLCEADAAGHSILLSPRSRDRSRRLSERYAAVEVATGNQQVLDQCDLVFLAVRPQDAAEVLKTLSFRENQRVVSFIATISSADIARQVRPAEFIGRVAPVPPIARRKGPVAMCPPNPQLADFFGPLGTVIQVAEEAQLDAFFSVSALMAPYFELLESVSAWVRAQGVDAVDADTYTGALFRGHRGEIHAPKGRRIRRAGERTRHPSRNQRTTAPRVAGSGLLRPGQGRPRSDPGAHAGPRHPSRHPEPQVTRE